MHRALVFAEGLDLQPAHPADERKAADAAVEVLSIENRESLLAGKSRLAKRPNQRPQFRGGEVGFGEDGQRPQIQQRAINPALATGARQCPKRFLARLEIEMFVGIEADEFACPDQLQFD
jgi:hypothetical protein